MEQEGHEVRSGQGVEDLPDGYPDATSEWSQIGVNEF